MTCNTLPGSVRALDNFARSSGSPERCSILRRARRNRGAFSDPPWLDPIAVLREPPDVATVKRSGAIRRRSPTRAAGLRSSSFSGSRVAGPTDDAQPPRAPTPPTGVPAQSPPWRGAQSSKGDNHLVGLLGSTPVAGDMSNHRTRPPPSLGEGIREEQATRLHMHCPRSLRRWAARHCTPVLGEGSECLGYRRRWLRGRDM